MATIQCKDVQAQVSSYLEGELEHSLVARLDAHFAECAQCRAVRDGMRNVVKLAGSPQALDVPAGFSDRLYSRLPGSSSGVAGEMPLGIASGSVPPGSHLLYFWESDAEFERGVRFLYPGLQAGEHCVIFGHDEALEKVQQVLRNAGYDPEELVRRGALSVLRRHAAADATLAEIGAVLQAAVRAGASAIRFLGNLGMGRDPLPAGEADVHELESKASSLISNFPCVIVCMYDVRTLSGSIIVRAGLETHGLTVCHEGLCENPYFTSQGLPAHLRHVH